MDLVGVDFRRFVRAIVAWSDIPVIIGLWNDEESHQHAFHGLEAGARGLVLKTMAMLSIHLPPRLKIASSAGRRLPTLGTANPATARSRHGPSAESSLPGSGADCAGPPRPVALDAQNAARLEVDDDAMDGLRRALFRRSRRRR
jgi:hypothetical protein